jgi:hypothetical protein
MNLNWWQQHSNRSTTTTSCLLNYSTVQIPSWEAYRFVASQEILRVLLNPKVPYRIQKCTPPVSICLMFRFQNCYKFVRDWSPYNVSVTVYTTVYVHTFYVIILKVIKPHDMTSYRWVHRYQSFTVCCFPLLQGSSLFWTNVTLYKGPYQTDGISIIIAPRTSYSHFFFFFLAFTLSKYVFVSQCRIRIPSKCPCSTRCISIFESAHLLKLEFHNIEDVDIHKFMCAFKGS